MRLKLTLLALAAFLLPGTTYAKENHEPFVAKASTLQPLPIVVAQKEYVVEAVRATDSTGTDTSTLVRLSSDAQSGLLGSIGYASPFGNCINQPGLNRETGNPITWSVTTETPTLGATALFRYNHVGLVVGIWGNGDLEIAHQNYQGGQHRFPASTFRGYR